MRIPKKIRNVTNWLPFGDQRRNKQMWHVNKSNAGGLIFQTKGFLEIIKSNNLENKKWGSIKESLKRDMSNKGYAASRITDSRIGTLRSEIYQLGLISYEDSKITITKAGERFLINPKETLLNQFIKLQFTNPQIIRYCKDIYLFPIRGIIKLTLELDYLTKEELGYIVFIKYLYEDDYEDIRNQILKFRSLDENDKIALLNKFKKTPEGHVSLAAASSVGYLCSKLKLTEFFSYERGILKIQQSYKEKAQEILLRYNQIAPYPYGDGDLELWFEYFSNPTQEFPPELKKISFLNKTKEELSLSIYNQDKEIKHLIINTSEVLEFPFFNNREYRFIIKDFANNKEFNFNINTKLNEDIIINNKEGKPVSFNEEYFIKAIKELSNGSEFDNDFKKKLEFLETKYGDEFSINKSSLRGARLEELFFELLSLLKEKGEIDDLFWGGKINEFGLPTSTPGGINGNPDIVIIRKNILYILELTTQKAKSSQEDSETFSIIRHLRNFEKNNKELLFNKKVKKVLLIFSAPIIYEDIIKSLNSIMSQEKLEGNFFTITDLAERLISKTNRIFIN